MKTKNSGVVDYPQTSASAVAEKPKGAKAASKVAGSRRAGCPKKPTSSSRSSYSDCGSDSESECASSSASPPPNKKKPTTPRKGIHRKKRFVFENTEYNKAVEMAYARTQERNRRLRSKQEERAPIDISEKDFKKMAKENMKRTMELFTLWKMNENDMEKKDAEKLLQSHRTKTVPENIEKKIMDLIEEGVKLQMLKPQKTRRCTTVDKIKIYVNQDQFNAKITDKAQFEYTERNFVSSAEEDADLRKAVAAMNISQEHKDMCCSCEGFCNPKTCLCIALQKEFAQCELGDRHRYYTCGPGCACKGKCATSLVDLPEGGVEVMMHHFTPKGFATRARQYFYPGSMVTEITGEYTDTANLLPLDDYSIDMTKAALDEKPIVAILDSKHTKSKVVRDAMNRLEPEYKKKLKKFLKNNYSLNPFNYSTTGRFLSSSCYPNVTPTVVYSEGLSPLNVRCLFRALVPIFPNQEIAFSYSDEYIYQQLKDICKCGSLCCISNRHLYKYLRFHHFEKFYELLYTELFEDYKKNVMEPVNDEIRSRLRSSSMGPDGPARKKVKVAPAPAPSVPARRLKHSQRERTQTVFFNIPR